MLVVVRHLLSFVRLARARDGRVCARSRTDRDDQQVRAARIVGLLESAVHGVSLLVASSLVPGDLVTPRAGCINKCWSSFFTISRSTDENVRALYAGGAVVTQIDKSGRLSDNWDCWRLE